MATVAWTTDPAIERTARRRAAARLGWIVHAGVFVLVNLFLFTILAGSGRHYAATGLLGWGFGLVVHGLAVLVYSGGLMDKLVRRERSRLLTQRDPW